jgi:hypothetical protein
VPAFHCYPTLGTFANPSALVVAALCFGLLGWAVIVVERCSPS